MSKRFEVQGISRKTGRLYISGSFHNESVAQDIADHGNRNAPRNRIVWQVVDTLTDLPESFFEPSQFVDARDVNSQWVYG